MGDEMTTERELKRVEAMICSMTIQERREPKIIKQKRRERIARGSGTTLQDVNALIKQFTQMQRMMKQFTGGKGGRKGQPDPQELLKMLRGM